MGGGQGKALHQRQTNDERTTNERRTTLTIILPRQDSQNPRANNLILGSVHFFNAF